jgi:hypothetical protein
MEAQVCFCHCPETVSTAECERGFSIMKRIKSAQRSCMEQDTLKCLMRINMFGPSVENHDPSRDIEHWLTTGGTKHVKGHKISPALSLPRKIRNRELESEDK